MLTSHYPATSDLCLAHVAAISNDGVDTAVPGVHVWAGPLANGDFVMALDNRDATSGQGVAAFSLLEAPGVGPDTRLCVRDLFNNATLGVHQGSITVGTLLSYT